MAATLRELRGRIRSAGSIKKITKAQELIATSRISRAQARLQAARPYATEITNMLTTLAAEAALDHPLLVERDEPNRAGVLVVSSDRGLCGAYNSNILRRAEELFSLLREEGKTPILYVVGRKALNYYTFRNWKVTESWTGFSERPSYENAQEIASTLVETFLAGADDVGDDPGPDGILGVDELHIVCTEFKSMMSQSAEARRIAPMVVEYVEEEIGRAEELFSLMRQEGKTPILYTVGRKALNYYRFRNWKITESWSGFSEQPSYEQAREIGSTLVDTFMAGADDVGDDPGPDGILGVDELHIVYTEFKSMMSQNAVAYRIAPMVVEYVEEETGPRTLYSFEPDATELFDVAAAAVPEHPCVRRAARSGGIGVGVAPAGDEVGHRQRRRSHQGPHTGGQPRASGPDHPGNQRNRRWRKRVGRRPISPVGSEEEYDCYR